MPPPPTVLRAEARRTVYPSAAEPARPHEDSPPTEDPRACCLSAFFDALHCSRAGMHGVQPEDPRQMALSDVFDDLDCRRQDLSDPRSPRSPIAAPQAPFAAPSDDGASASPGTSDERGAADPFGTLDPRPPTWPLTARPGIHLRW